MNVEKIETRRARGKVIERKFTALREQGFDPVFKTKNIGIDPLQIEPIMRYAGHKTTPECSSLLEQRALLAKALWNDLLFPIHKEPDAEDMSVTGIHEKAIWTIWETSWDKIAEQYGLNGAELEILLHSNPGNSPYKVGEYWCAETLEVN